MYTHSDKNQVLKQSDLNSDIHSWGSGLSSYIIKQIIFPLKVRTSRPQSFSKPQGYPTGSPHGAPQTHLDLLASLPGAALGAHTKPLAPTSAWQHHPWPPPRVLLGSTTFWGGHHPSLQGSILQMRKMRFSQLIHPVVNQSVGSSQVSN